MVNKLWVNAPTVKMAVELPKLREALFRRHFIHPLHRATEAANVVDTLLGLHAARLSSPYVALGCRLNRFSPATLREQLNAGNLIKFRCVRKTLHISTAKYSGILHRATLKYRTGDIERQLAQYGFNETTLSKACKWVEHHVSPKALPVRIIENEISKWLAKNSESTLSERQRLAVSRLIIKFAWEHGVLCYLNRAAKWFNEDRYYASRNTYYPHHRLREGEINEAEVTLLKEYILTFGPVSISDACWWSGLSKGKVLRAIEALSPNVVNITVQGLSGDLWATPERIAEIQKMETPAKDWVSLLGHEDPTLKGYFESRDIYVEKKHRELLFNSIGEARASVIHNGVAIGVWTWDAHLQKIKVAYFEKQRPTIMQLVSSEAGRLAGILRSDSEPLLFRTSTE